jgi:heme/copper-type cytochrome/quinol oxidase subunit 3
MPEQTISYVVKPHPETELYDAKFGVWLFLASEIMLFGALFSSYILLRTGSLVWPVQHDLMNIPIGATNTIVLIVSSMTMVMSWLSLKRNQFKMYRLYLGLTVLLGLIFLILKTYEYIDHIHHHLYPSTNVFIGMYYTMTGLHALHVIGGVIVNAYFWGPGSRLWSSDPGRLTNRIEAAGLYWHFVDIVWLFLLPTLYLI